MEEPGVVWKDALTELEKRLPKSQIEAWVTPLRPLAVEGNVLVLGVGSELHRSYLVRNCQEKMEAALQATSALPLAVRFDLIPEMAPAAAIPAAPLHAMRPAPPIEDTPLTLNARYTFETFVVGNSNRHAHAASQGVAENPGRGYNPLFLYGGVGLGKTHLLHAIGHRIRVRFPTKRIVHTSCERFMNSMIESIRDQSMAEFRRKFRQADLLLIDDIQFLQGREATQEEFFHTFNDLHTTFRQIVMTSDTPPSEIKLEERLRSRFQGGLVADLQPPDVETRIAILKKKAENDSLFIPEEVLVLVAEACPSNIRELEGALNRVVAYSSLTSMPLSLDLAKEAIRDLLIIKKSPQTFDKIKTAVATFFSIDPALLSERTRTEAIVYPRQIAMFFCHEILGASSVAIGEKFGGRDHSTVLHAINKIRELLASDDQTVHALGEIRKLLAQ